MRVCPRIPSNASYSSSIARERDSISPISRNSGTVMNASLVSVVTRLLANMPNAEGPRMNRMPATLISKKTTKTGSPAKVSAITTPKMPLSVTYQGRLAKGGLRARRLAGGGADRQHQAAREVEGGAAEAVDDGREQPPLGDEQGVGRADAAVEGAQRLLGRDEGGKPADDDAGGEHPQRQPAR